MKRTTIILGFLLIPFLALFGQQCNLDLTLSSAWTNCSVPLDIASGYVINNGSSQITCLWAEAIFTQNLASWTISVGPDLYCSTVPGNDQLPWYFNGTRYNWKQDSVVKIYISIPSHCNGEMVFAAFFPCN